MSYDRQTWIIREGTQSRSGKTFFASQHDLAAPDLEAIWLVRGFFVDPEFSDEYPDEKAVPALTNTLTDEAAATAKKVWIASMNKLSKPKRHPARPQSMYEKFVQPGGGWDEKPFLFESLEDAKKAVIACWTIESLAMMTEAKRLYEEATERRHSLIEELLSQRGAA
jgi:hypothetical protein